MSMVRAPRFAKARLSTGPTLHYAESGDPAGTPVLFLHGWPDSWFSYSRVMPLLPESIRAIAIDQRGFGESDRPEGGYAITDLAADAVAVLDALGIDRAAVVGHSFGSFVARAVAISRPERVTALALIGTGFSGSNPTTRELQVMLRDLPDPIPDAFAREFQTSTIYHPVPPEFFEGALSESLKLPPRLWRLTMNRLVEYDDTARLSRIACPTLLLWGDRDGLFSRAEQQAFLEARPGTRLIVYDETGHCPNWERPELVAADIAAFL